MIKVIFDEQVKVIVDKDTKVILDLDDADRLNRVLEQAPARVRFCTPGIYTRPARALFLALVAAYCADKEF
jgi:hypothetical protein